MSTLLLVGCGASSTTATGPAAVSSASSAASASPGAGCPTPLKLDEGQGMAIDYVDTLRLQGLDYLISEDAPPPTWDPAKPGTPAGRITCTLTSYLVDPSYELRDGDATFVPVGTAVYLVPMTQAATVAVVKVGDRWRVYRPVSRP